MNNDLESQLEALGQELRSSRKQLIDDSRSDSLKAAMKAFDASKQTNESQAAIWSDLGKAIFSSRGLVPAFVIIFALFFTIKSPSAPETSVGASPQIALITGDADLDFAVIHAELETSFDFIDDEEFEQELDDELDQGLLEYASLSVPSDDYSLILDLSDIDQLEDNNDDESEEILEFRR